MTWFNLRHDVQPLTYDETYNPVLEENSDSVPRKAKKFYPSMQMQMQRDKKENSTENKAKNYKMK